jgi:hypothetical protein
LFTYVEEGSEFGNISLGLLRKSLAAMSTDACRRIAIFEFSGPAGVIMIFFLKNTTSKKGPISFLKFPV